MHYAYSHVEHYKIDLGIIIYAYVSDRTLEAEALK